MRIRKNKKLSSLLFPHASAEGRPQPYVCKLNQAPWDVISDSEEPTNPYSSHLQFNGYDSLTRNGASLGDSIGAIESVASMEKPEIIVIDDEDDTEAEPKKLLEGNEEAKMETEFGLKAEDKTSLLLKSCNHSAPPRSSSPVTIKRREKTATRRGRGRGIVGSAVTGKRGSFSSSRANNPYEFYYYSGFGPLWGKRRGERVRGGGSGERGSNIQLGTDTAAIVTAVGTAATDSSNTTSQNNNTHSSSSQFELRNNDEFNYADDYVDEDDDDEEDYDRENSRDNRKRKRMRKPVKARSLKSLM